MHQKATPVRAWMNGLRFRIPLDGKIETVDAMGVSSWSFTFSRFDYDWRSDPVSSLFILMRFSSRYVYQV